MVQHLPLLTPSSSLWQLCDRRGHCTLSKVPLLLTRACMRAQTIGKVGCTTELITQCIEEVDGRAKKEELLSLVRAVPVRAA